ncbi:MAG: phosphate-starvation-inducible PsiE family protein [Candidatus Competibacteraceae bacterium]
MTEKSDMNQLLDDKLVEELHIDQAQEPLVHGLHVLIRLCVRLLAVLMTLVIIWSVLDVGWVLYNKIMTPPVGLLNVNDILATFSAFMATLIAIEIFVNIVLYLRDDVLHVKLVLATALMAIARKVIVLDYKTIEPEYIWATAGVILALSVGYWLVSKEPQT